jgi:multiple sugar transport system ATP-binding protein
LRGNPKPSPADNASASQAAAPLEIYNEPANLFFAGFLGSPPMNFLKGTLCPEGDTHVFEEAGDPVRLALTHRTGLGAHTRKNITLGVLIFPRKSVEGLFC